jgi:CheY-like chemotaxis protein
VVDVLLVEDNLADVILLQEALGEAGLDYQITRAADGQEAMDWLDRIRCGQVPPPALIIMDLNLPRMDGGRLIELINADPLLETIPLVVLTTATPDGPQGLPVWYRPENYFIKPARFDELTVVVQDIEHYRRGRLATA